MDAAPSMDDGMKMDMGTMNQFFTASLMYRHLLFYNINLNNKTDLALIIVVIFILSFLMQLMKMLRDILKQHLVSESLLKRTFKITDEEKVAKRRIRFQEEMAEEEDSETPGTSASTASTSSTVKLIGTHAAPGRKRCPNFALKLVIRLLSTVLHTLQLVIAYILMFLAMTYNIWIFIGIIGAQALAYFLVMPYLGVSLT